MIPQTHFQFNVDGKNLRELEERAEQQVLNFLSESGPTIAFEYELAAASYVVSNLGEIVLWSAEVRGYTYKKGSVPA